MTVHVEFMGPVKRPTPEPQAEVTLPDGGTIEDLLLALGYQPMHVRHIGVFRGDVRLPRGSRLADGDRVVLTLPLGGG